jgi:hypothetical protein
VGIARENHSPCLNLKGMDRGQRPEGDWF